MNLLHVQITMGKDKNQKKPGTQIAYSALWPRTFVVYQSKMHKVIIIVRSSIKRPHDNNRKKCLEIPYYCAFFHFLQEK
jgi:hypothetical protein